MAKTLLQAMPTRRPLYKRGETSVTSTTSKASSPRPPDISRRWCGKLQPPWDARRRRARICWRRGSPRSISCASTGQEETSSASFCRMSERGWHKYKKMHLKWENTRGGGGLVYGVGVLGGA